jgi:hypothetical protein
MAEVMWSSAKEAGFALAAWLADDRDLVHVQAALDPAQLAAQRAHAASTNAPAPANAVPGTDAARHKAETVQRLLRVLRPPLDERALALPPRARTLLSRLAAPALRKRLLEGSAPARAHYQADEELLALLLRAVRNTRTGSPP